MTLDSDPDSETERWVCPTCGRIMIVRWSPDFERMTLEAGDEYALHSGGKGGAQVRSVALEMSDGDRDRAARTWLSELGNTWDGPAA
jgi:hypothetical protein